MSIPDFKRIPGTQFTVDAFRYPSQSVDAYFLTHAHADHYTGLNERWQHGEIWCTAVTARLVQHITGVNPELCRVLPLDTPIDVHGVTVTAIDANHCPGAAILLFQLSDGRRYVHCGDMRYSPSMRACRHLAPFRGADAVFLDTTYAHPRHLFPPQGESVDALATLVQKYLAEKVSGRLILIAAYNIGKEKIFLEIARRCGIKLLVTAAKMAILQLLDWPEELSCSDVFTTNPEETPVHVVSWNWLGDTWPYFRPNYQNMEVLAKMHSASTCVGFVPTGWTFQTKREAFPVYERAPWRIHLIPYSEHSSFSELQEFVAYLRPVRIIPTVGATGDKADANVRKVLTHFQHLCDSTAAKRGFLMTLGGSGQGSSRQQQAPEQHGPQKRSGTDAGAEIQIKGGVSGSSNERARSPPLQSTQGHHSAGNTAGGNAVDTLATGPGGSLSVKSVKASSQLAGNVGPGEAHGGPLPSSRAQHTSLGLTGTASADALPAHAAVLGQCAVVHEGSKGSEDAEQKPVDGIDDHSCGVHSAVEDGSLSFGTMLQSQQHALGGEAHTAARGTCVSQCTSINNTKLPDSLLEGGCEDDTSMRAAAEQQSHPREAGATCMSTDNSAAAQATSRAVSQLVALLDGQVDVAAAEAAVRRTGGSVEAAANVILDAAQTSRGTASKPAGGVNGEPRASAAATSKLPSPAKAPKRAGPGVQTCKPTKRPRGTKASTNTESATRPSGSHQPGILSFFAASATGNSKSGGTDRKATGHEAATAASAHTHQDSCKHLSDELQTGEQGCPTQAGGERGTNADRATPSSAAPAAAAASTTSISRTPRQQTSSDTGRPAPAAWPAAPRSARNTSPRARSRESTEDARDNRAGMQLLGSSEASKHGTCNMEASIEVELQGGRPLTHEPSACAPTSPNTVHHVQQAQAAQDHVSYKCRASREGANDGLLGGRGAVGCDADGVEAKRGASQRAQEDAGSAVLQSDAVPCEVSMSEARPATGGSAGLTPDPGGVAGPVPDRSGVVQEVHRYKPLVHACWRHGPVPYMHIASTFTAMEATTKRLQLGDALTNMFRSVLAITPADLEATAYLAVGKIAPDYEGGELQVGGRTVSNAIVEVTGSSSKRLGELYTSLGDLGDVAAACKGAQRVLLPLPELTARDVLQRMRDVAARHGPGSAAQKQRIVTELIRRCRGPEVKYLVRTLIRNLRIGANWRSVLSALGRAAACHAVSPVSTSGAPDGVGKLPAKAVLDAAAQKVLEAFHRCPNLSLVVRGLLEAGVDGLEQACGVSVGVPLQPMLAKITTGLEDCAAQVAAQCVLAEFKYDGQRSQIHVMTDGTVKMFSRRCEDNTVMFPDVATSVLNAMLHPARPRGTDTGVPSGCMSHEAEEPPMAARSAECAAAPVATSLIVDAELVAVDRADGNRFRAFQELSTRSRGETRAEAVQVHVCVFLFDLLALDGVTLLARSLRERRRLLRQAFPALQPGHVQLAQCVELRINAPPATAAAAAGGTSVPGRGCAAAVGSSSRTACGVAASDSGSDGGSVESCTADAPEASQGALRTPHSSPKHQAASASEGNATADKPVATGGDTAADTPTQTGSADGAGGSGAHPESTDAATLRAKVSAASSCNADVGPATEGHATVAAACPSADGWQVPEDAPMDAAGWPVWKDIPFESAASMLEGQLLSAVAASTEGLMLKFLDSRCAYRPSKRCDAWLKVKKDYCEHLRDSLDLVPIGAWHGNGRKAGWYSPFLLACWDPEQEVFQSVCRVMSGFTDAFYINAKARFDADHLLPGPRSYYRTLERPDVWFDPVEVWEIRGADLTLSPVHRAALGRIKEDRGCSLRFPRFIKVREDKAPTDASSPDYIVDLFHAQTRKAIQGS